MSVSIMQASISGNNNSSTSNEVAVYEMQKFMNFTVKSGNNMWTLPILVKGQRIGRIVTLKINQFVVQKTDLAFVIARQPHILTTGVDMNGIDLEIYTSDTIDPKFIPRFGQVTGVGGYKVSASDPASQYNNPYIGIGVIDTDGTIKITGESKYLVPLFDIIWFRTGIQFNYIV